MIKRTLLIVAALLLSVSTVEARQRTISTAVDPNCNILWPCEGVTVSPRGQRVVKAMGGFGTATKIYKREAKVNYRDNVNESRRIRKQPRVIAAQNEQPSFQRTIVNRVSTAVQMLPHPAGCPRSLFCGCGAAVEVFGTPRRDLWLAANWLKFPRAAPAPGMVAARHGHVFVLKQQLSDGQWLVADYNSGGRASRLHVRPLRGYTIVNPHA